MATKTLLTRHCCLFRHFTRCHSRVALSREHDAPPLRPKVPPAVLTDEALFFDGKRFPRRPGASNVTPAICQYLHRRLLTIPHHPLTILVDLISAALPPELTRYRHLSPVVTPEMNFDQLCTPPEHPSRSTSDSYYINQQLMLRTHTSAHEVTLLRENPRGFLLAADVYRRDEIDRTHFPVFHQMEGMRQWATPEEAQGFIAKAMVAEGATEADLPQLADAQESYPHRTQQMVAWHLQMTLQKAILSLFAALSLPKPTLKWVDTTFPFTSPSFELEVKTEHGWLELLGCGVSKSRVIQQAGKDGAIAWAFGLGLERVAMALFQIHDIRLFWSEDARFLDQFREKTSFAHFVFKPFSAMPECYKDVSFWIDPKTWKTDNDVFDIIRQVGGELVESVKLIDHYVDNARERESKCYRILYRHMTRNVSNSEINVIQASVNAALQKELHVTLR